MRGEGEGTLWALNFAMLAATLREVFPASDLWLTFVSSRCAALVLEEDCSLAETGAELQALSRGPFVFIGFADSNKNESESFVCASTEGCTFDRPEVKGTFVCGPLGVLLSGDAGK